MMFRGQTRAESRGVPSERHWWNTMGGTGYTNNRFDARRPGGFAWHRELEVSRPCHPSSRLFSCLMSGFGKNQS